MIALARTPVKACIQLTRLSCVACRKSAVLCCCALLEHWSANALMLRAANRCPRRTKTAASSLLTSAMTQAHFRTQQNG